MSKSKKLTIPPNNPRLQVKTKKTYKNPKGDPVPVDMMKEVNILKDHVGRLLVSLALEYHEALKGLKAFSLSILDQYRKRHAMINNTEPAEGGITVATFDQTMKVETYFHPFTTFGEGLKQAKKLMGDVISEGTQGINPVLREIFLDAFTLKDGQVSTSKVDHLASYEVDDPRWIKAVQIINDDKILRYRKQYLRFQIKEKKDGSWQTIYIDLSKIPVDIEKV